MLSTAVMIFKLAKFHKEFRSSKMGETGLNLDAKRCICTLYIVHLQISTMLAVRFQHQTCCARIPQSGSEI